MSETPLSIQGITAVVVVACGRRIAEQAVLDGLLVREDGLLVAHDGAHVDPECIHVLAHGDLVLLGLIPVHIKPSELEALCLFPVLEED